MNAEKASVFFADHPFLFTIDDRETGCMLFMGKVGDPTKE
jgi:serpin B